MSRRRCSSTRGVWQSPGRSQSFTVSGRVAAGGDISGGEGTSHWLRCTDRSVWKSVWHYGGTYQRLLEPCRVWEMLVEIKPDVFSLFLFCCCLWVCLEGTVSLGWDRTPSSWSPPPSDRERMEMVGFDARASRATEKWGVISTANLVEPFLRIKESTKQGRSKRWYLDADWNCEKGLALRQIQNQALISGLTTTNSHQQTYWGVHHPGKHMIWSWKAKSFICGFQVKD